jgi:S1-C subfamily serine protease
MARAWLALAAAGLAALPRVPGAAPPASSEREGRARGGLPELSRLARSALPAVVGVLTTQEERTGPAEGDPMKDLLDRFRGEGVRKGIASGFIIDPQGFIITNAHVLEGASRVQVELGDEQERLPARVVGRDEPTDVALLKVEAGRTLAALPLGDSDQIQIAEWVMVIGNPFGLAHSVTVGVVSHTGRADIAPQGHDGYHDFIQTDASINPGSSGGPLVNLRGEVVGIATAINATGQGIGFAVPINMAKGILQQLREQGHVVRSWMGVSVRELRHAALEGGGRQVVVTDVVSGGPAASSGLKVGDVITGLDGQHIPSAARLRWYVSTAGVGRKVSLTVRRGGAERSLRVELAELPRPADSGGAEAGGLGSAQ